MYKTIMSAVVLGAATLNPLQAGAADDARSSIHITANIPNKQFHVQPRNPDFGKDEVMHYDPVHKTLSILRHTYDVKNTEGSVHAYIEGGLPWLTNGSADPLKGIPLLVRFNNVTLSAIPQEVVDDATSTPGTQAEMVIRNASVIQDHQTGLYNADFTVIFDAVPRVPL
ncbi:adhesin [Pseudomonas sp. R1-7]|uniref:adhesin n=1 Tax=Pseudomonas sp. R1-7 TaxID=2817398 RepID=UPI003DAA2859